MSNTDDDLMAPETSPGTTGKKTGVRRVNNMPMYIIGAVLGSFLLMMVLVAIDRANQQGLDEREEKPSSANMATAHDMVGDMEGIIPPEIPEIPENEVLIATPVEKSLPPMPPPEKQSALKNKPERDLEAERIREAKFAMFRDAVKAKTSVQTMAPRSSGSTHSANLSEPRNRKEMIQRMDELRREASSLSVEDPTTAYKARLAQAKQLIEEGKVGNTQKSSSGSRSSMLLRTSTASKDGYGKLQNNNDKDRWILESKVDTPATPYTIRAGFVLPATLITGINSELPGHIIAQVSQNVYDTPVGRHLLIPQGSRLTGTYSSEVAYGQGRVLVAWQRILFPDGKALDIGSMPGSDGAGYAGLNDKTNNHYLKIFGSALLMSAVTAGVTISQDDGKEDSNNGTRAGDVLSQALGQQLGEVTAQMISKNLNIAPTLEIRPGFRFNVIVTKDMTFSKPYQNFDY